MRISDSELLQAAWENQLRLLSRGVVHKYIGGSYGLCRDDVFWLTHSMAEHSISRHRITSKIGPQQLLARIRKLYADGRLASTYGDRLLTFYIPGEVANAAFKAARNWWLEKDLPEGTENGGLRSLAMPKEEFDRLASECAEYLLESFPTYDMGLCSGQVPAQSQHCAQA